jgi:hypothetical protein
MDCLTTGVGYAMEDVAAPRRGSYSSPIWAVCGVTSSLQAATVRCFYALVTELIESGLVSPNASINEVKGGVDERRQ